MMSKFISERKPMGSVRKIVKHDERGRGLICSLQEENVPVSILRPATEVPFAFQQDPLGSLPGRSESLASSNSLSNVPIVENRNGMGSVLLSGTTRTSTPINDSWSKITLGTLEKAIQKLNKPHGTSCSFEAVGAHQDIIQEQIPLTNVSRAGKALQTIVPPNRVEEISGYYKCRTRARAAGQLLLLAAAAGCGFLWATTFNQYRASSTNPVSTHFVLIGSLVASLFSALYLFIVWIIGNLF